MFAIAMRGLSPVNASSNYEENILIGSTNLRFTAGKGVDVGHFISGAEDSAGTYNKLIAGSVSKPFRPVPRSYGRTDLSSVDYSQPATTDESSTQSELWRSAAYF